MIQKFFKFILPFTAFTIPLFFLPLTVDFFLPNKQLLLIIIASLCLLFWGLDQLFTGRLKLTITPATLPLLALSAIFIISSLLQSHNHLYALNNTTSTIVALTVIFLTTTSLSGSSVIMPTIFALLLALSLNGLIVIYQFTGLSTQLTNLAWLKNATFNPAGGSLVYLTFAFPLLPLSIYLAFKQSSGFHKILLFICTALTIVASIISINALLPKNNQPSLVLLPLSAGWAIAVDVFKNIRTALLGTGPETFLNTFTQLKPINLNHTIYWNVRFNYSSNEFLQLLTTVGLLGLLAFVAALLRPLLIRPQKNILRLLLLLTIIANLLVPSNVVLYTLTFVTLILVSLDHSASRPVSYSFSHRLKFVHLVIFVLVSALLALHGYFRFHTYASELYFYRSFVAAQNNAGTDTYNYQIKAVENNPSDYKLRIAYSQTNLALANSIASKTNPSDQDKANVAQLIQQSIREAKAATALEPNNVLAWENLANIYRQLINVAQGADQWATAAYSQAIALDPINPQLRLELGGVYFSLKNYDAAVRLFQQAVEAKADWPNAHYNLAHAYLENKQYAQAIASLRVVTQLVDPTSADYQKAQDELKNLEKQYPQAKPSSTAPSEDLQTPTPIPSPTSKLLQLPDGSGLNIPQPTPTN